METLVSTNVELAHAYVEAIVDLDVLIEHVEREVASEPSS